MIKFISKILYLQLLLAFKPGRIMSTLAAKALGVQRIFYTKATRRNAAIALLLILYGCFTPSLDVTNTTWKIYKNSRYGFEFPYPSNWKTLATPTNADGIVFASPKNNSVEIRAWASNQILESITTQKPNFQTTQGLTGILEVEVDSAVSAMTLTLTQNQVQYNWQGRAPSQELKNYYPLFYYIAQQYRIPQ
ncbi:hypothetical protein [Anabaena sp. UHCC 0399]|uniref:hypothetical protein n=1 Tax=Anabaena sp. UHCC 0399 TaxID=3110238 RepID=UPI002B216DEB|nr:hypothetical protein [Anabaena sp. UHCC 0399]MEA5564093.1 hypothetical protein [Anabaena sp. UHCC 0399]